MTGQLRLEDPGESQRRRVDNLLSDLVRKFPPKVFSKKVEWLVMHAMASNDGSVFYQSGAMPSRSLLKFLYSCCFLVEAVLLSDKQVKEQPRINMLVFANLCCALKGIFSHL